MVQAQRGDGQDAEAALVNDEWILIGAVNAAAVFHDAQTAREDLVVDAMIEQDDAIGDVLFETAPGEGALAALAGDDRGDTFIFKPAKEAAQLCAQDALVLKAGEKGFDGVEDDPLGSDGVDGGRQADEEAFEIVVAGFVDLVAFDADKVEDQLLLPD